MYVSPIDSRYRSSLSVLRFKNLDSSFLPNLALLSSRTAPTLLLILARRDTPGGPFGEYARLDM